eukprot:Sspe_Gene.101128::Locus_75713_Transcript_1_1_Confidence_1.000_Length_1149::g.101128::m.101128
MVRFGVVDQLLMGTDESCVSRYCKHLAQLRGEKEGGECPYLANIRVLGRDALHSRGPMHARAIGAKLLQDEEFCLQVDSHTSPVQDWDVKMIEEWSKAADEHAVLTTYIQRLEDMHSRTEGNNLNNWHEVPYLCTTVKGMHGMVRNQQATSARELRRPLRSCLWGAGLSFSKCHAERAVLHDPFSDGVFDGEEFSRAVRLWTHGYDMYTPSRSYIFHDYTKAQSDPKRWTPRWQLGGVQKRSYDRLKKLIGLPSEYNESLGKYGLGTARTLADYEQLCGFSLQAKGSVVTAGEGCGRFCWVPWNVTAPAPVRRRVHRERNVLPPTSHLVLAPAIFALAIFIFVALVCNFATPRRRRVGRAL